MPLAFLYPEWPAASHVRAAFTTRAGGVSVAPFDSLNLGGHVNDNAVHVAKNRALLQQSIQTRPVFLKQVHGVEVVSINADTVDGTVADACVTQQRGVACTIMVADCLPVLFTDRAGSFVGAAHAGWRGLLGQAENSVHNGVLEHIYQCFRPLDQENSAQIAIKNIANDILVWFGPCIGPQQFEVGAEVKAAFEAVQPDAARHFQKIASAAGQPQKYLANLPALARQRLQAMGITQIYGNDGSQAWCTVSNPSQFFSHRRDTGRLGAGRPGSTGRMAACIWLAD
jgi:polyphenol oxidase